MAQMSVAQFASELRMDPARLLEQLQSAGVNKRLAEDSLTEQDKTRLLDYLHKVHGGGEARKKITLTRKQTTEIKKADSTGRSRTIQVEVRKKRVFVKRDPAVGGVEAEVPTAPADAAVPVVSAEQLELREAEDRRAGRTDRAPKRRRASQAGARAGAQAQGAAGARSKGERGKVG